MQGNNCIQENWGKPRTGFNRSPQLNEIIKRLFYKCIIKHN